jgi:prepilin-type N-terminal cleavage/methylation domain-containing protein
MKNGFTLLETLVVLAAAAVLLCIGANSFVKLAPKYRLRRATWEIQSRLNYARYRAIFEGRPVRVTFNSFGYRVERYDEDLKGWRPEVTGSVDGVLIEANNSPTFYPVGTVSNLATITVSNSWGKCQITLSISGRLRVTVVQ